MSDCAFRPIGTCCYVRFPVPLGCRAPYGSVLNGCSEQWVTDSLHWRGVVLMGEHAHWCEDWDGLPIDETCGDDNGDGEWPCACNVGREWMERRRAPRSLDGGGGGMGREDVGG